MESKWSRGAEFCELRSRRSILDEDRERRRMLGLEV